MIQPSDGNADSRTHACADALNWQASPSFTLLDVNFGAAEAFLTTWAQWTADPQRPERLHYVAITPTPATAQQILDQAANRDLALELTQEWWGLLPGIHRLRLAGGRVSLTLAVGDLHPMLKSLVFQADAIYLNDFGRVSPGALEAEQGTLEALKALARHCRVGTLLFGAGQSATVQSHLTSLGYHVDGDKATFSPPWQLRRQAANAMHPSRAIVIGAGLSGAAVARQLAEHGWWVEVLDRDVHPAAGASALPVGLMATHVTPDDAPVSRASRAGTRATLNALKTLCFQGQDWMRTGALEQGRDKVKNSWPAHWDEAEASAWFHRDADGLHHKNATWIKPGALVRAWLDHPHIQFTGGVDVQRLHRQGDEWTALGANGQTLAAAPLMVVCTAYGISQLLPRTPGQTSELPLDLVAGQVAMAAQKTDISMPLNGNGHLVPHVHSESGPFWLSGSTYERMPLSELDEAKGLEANRVRLERLLAQWPQASASIQAQFAQGEVKRWIGERCTSIDRLPLVGEWLPGLHLSAAQGSRGLCFAALCAELLVAQLAAEPLPLDRRLADGFAASRFHKAASISPESL